MVDPRDPDHLQPGFEHAKPGREALALRLSRAAARSALFGTETEAVRVGRYRVLSKIGAGAMGSVYAARDEELGRDVALKLLSSPDLDIDDRELAARLMRRGARGEAQALARLAHPNVVTVHDIGREQGVVFIAMELIEGQTLRQWQGTPRTWREVASLFADVAAGLAAAHAQGVVHGDFKPDNVMVDQRGQPRVVDFGLAVTIEELTGSSIVHSGPVDTQRGGTPAYMAPEVQLGGRADEGADQYSFGVSLLEALTGGDVRSGPRRPGVPRWLQHVVQRARADEPTERYSDLGAVELQLRSGLRPRSRALLWGAAAVFVGAAVALLWPAPDRCAGARERVAAVWGDADAERLGAKYANSDVANADETWTRVHDGVSAYASRWVAARETACRELEGAALDAKMGCLDDRLADFQALISALEPASAAVVEHAARAVAKLPTVDRCEGRAGDAPEQATELRAELRRSLALENTAQYEASLAVAQDAVRRADALGHPTTLCAALYRQGMVLQALGRFEDSEHALERAYWTAKEHDVAEYAAAAAGVLVAVVGERQARHDDGLTWARHAEAALTRDELSGADAAAFHSSVGGILFRKGEFDAALERFTRAEALWTEALGPDAPDVAAALDNQGAVRSSQARYTEAQALFERSLAIRVAAYGEHHPEVASTLHNLGATHNRRGDPLAAQPFLERALQIRTAAYGTRHFQVAETLTVLGDVADTAGRYAEARDYYERGLAVQKALHPDEPRHWSDAIVSLGNVAFHEDDTDAAKRYYLEGLDLRQAAFGPDNPTVISVRLNLAATHGAAGEFAEAEAQYRAVLPAMERAYGEDHPGVATALTGLGTCISRQGRYGDAVEYLERAYAILQRADVAPAKLTDTRFTLGEALWDSGRDRERARALLLQTHAVFVASGDQQLIAELEGFLRERKIAVP